MPAFHDSMRLFVAGMEALQSCGGSRNVNRWPSRMRRRIMRLASTSRRVRFGDGAVGVSAFLVEEFAVFPFPPVVGGQPCGG